MAVFDEELAAKLGAAAARHPLWRHDGLHFLVTSPDRQDTRRWIEDTISSARGDVSRLVSRLRSESAYLTAVHEVAVGCALLDMGCEVTCEPLLDGLTPDWQAAGGGFERPAIVEVVTDNAGNDVTRDERRWRELQYRVSALDVPVVLRATSVSGKRLEAPDSGQAKAMVTRLSFALKSDHHVGVKHEVDSARWEVLGNSVTGHAQLIVPTTGGTRSSSDVLEHVRPKVKKYSELALQLGWHLIVVLASLPGRPVDEGLVRAAMAGTQTIQIAFGPFDSGLLSDTQHKLQSAETPPLFHEGLSAVGWIGGVAENKPTLSLAPHVNARFPIVRGNAL